METFKAQGHPNIKATHSTTLMVTKDKWLTSRGDCIVAVASERCLRDLDLKMKEAMKSEETEIKLAFKVGGYLFEVIGKGDSKMTLSHPTDMVVRKSDYICDRTLMVCADKAACDIEQFLVRLLQNSDQIININLSVMCA